MSHKRTQFMKYIERGLAFEGCCDNESCEGSTD